MPCSVTSLDHVVLTVRDLNTTLEFYTRILDMQTEVYEPVGDRPHYGLRFGGQKLNLHEQGAEFAPTAPNCGPGTTELCFISRTPLADWIAFLATEGIALELGPVPRMGANGPMQSIFFRDPDQNIIEIANQRC